MKLYYPITVDLDHPYPLVLLRAKQSDIGRGVIITLTSCGAVLDPTGETVRIYAKKPDGTRIYATCTVENGKVKADLTSQMLAAAGKVQAEIEITSEGNRVSTPIFLIEVLPGNMDDGAIESSNEFTALEEALQKVAGYEARIQELEKAVQAMVEAFGKAITIEE